MVERTRAIPGNLLGRIVSVDKAAGFSIGTVSYLFAGAMAQAQRLSPHLLKGHFSRDMWRKWMTRKTWGDGVKQWARTDISVRGRISALMVCLRYATADGSDPDASQCWKRSSLNHAPEVVQVRVDGRKRRAQIQLWGRVAPLHFSGVAVA